MFRQGIRQFGTTALRAAAAEGTTSYGVRVSQAQGVVNGLTEGKSSNSRLASNKEQESNRVTSNWKHPPNSFKKPLPTNGLQCPGQSRIPEPRRQRQRPSCSIRRQRCRGERSSSPWRNRCRRDSRKHGYRTCARLPLKGIQACYLYAEYPVPRED